MGKWTQEEIYLLQSIKDNSLTGEELIKLFYPKSLKAIVSKRKKMGIKWSLKKVYSKSWTKEEEETILLGNYEDNDLSKILNRSKIAITKQRNKLNIFKKRRWAEKDILFLEENYNSLNQDLLIKELDRNWDSIVSKASTLKLSRSTDFLRNSDFNKLTDGSNQGFYWLGFLLADGHFNFKSKRITLSISMRDTNHMLEFCKFVNTTNIRYNYERKMISMAIQNVDKFSEIINILKLLSSNKTENPNDFSKLEISREQMFSMIIGFIDGDGSIREQTGRTDCSIAIHVHKKWQSNLEFMENFLYNYFSFEKMRELTKIGNDGYAKLIFSNYKLVRQIKKEVVNLKLLVLNRKWDKINENEIRNKEEINLKKDIIIKLIKEGKTPVSIIKLTNFSSNLVYSTFKNYKPF